MTAKLAGFSLPTKYLTDYFQNPTSAFNPEAAIIYIRSKTRLLKDVIATPPADGRHNIETFQQDHSAKQSDSQQGNHTPTTLTKHPYRDATTAIPRCGHSDTELKRHSYRNKTRGDNSLRYRRIDICTILSCDANGRTRKERDLTNAARLRA